MTAAPTSAPIAASTTALSILAAAAVSAAGAWLCRRAGGRQPAMGVRPPTPGERVLRYRPALVRLATWLGWLLAVAGPAATGVAALFAPPVGDEWVPFLLVGLIGVGAGAGLVRLRLGGVRVTVTDFDVTGERAGRPAVTIGWDEVTRVGWGIGRNGTGFTIEAADGRRVLAGAYLADLPALTDAFEAHLPPDAYAGAAARGFAWVALINPGRRR